MRTEPLTVTNDPDQTAPRRPGPLRTYVTAPGAVGVLAAAVLAVRAGAGPAASVAAGVAAAAVLFAAGRRADLHEDLAGAAALAGLVALATGGMLTVAGTRQPAISSALVVTGAAIAAGVSGWLLAPSPRAHGIAGAARQLLAPFERPTNEWGMALVGAGLAAPLIGTYSASIYESDSAWLVVSTEHVRAEGFQMLQDTQDVLLPHLVLSPLLDRAGYPAVVALTILATICLVAVTTVWAHRLGASLVGTIVAGFALLSFPEIVTRADHLPMYAPMLMLGYGSGMLLHRAMANPGTKAWVPIAAGVTLMASLEAHSIGQLFLMLPFLLLILHPWARARRPLAITLITAVVVGTPRILINLSVGGLTAFRSNYTDFMIQRGYLRMVNRDYWGQNVDASPLTYLRNIPNMAEVAFGQMSFAAVLVLIGYAGVRTRGRSRTFAVVAGLAYLLALTVASPGTYGRYLLPLSVGLALIAGIGATKALANRGDGRILASLLAVAVVAGGVINTASYAGRSSDRHHKVLSGAWPVFADLVDDGRGVIGVRSHELTWTDPALRAEFSRTLSEADFVTYLTWPDDEDVLEMMERNAAGWIYIHRDHSLELNYHQTWVGPAYGLEVRHVDRVAMSDAFCLVAEIDGNRLYRVGGCPGGYLPGPYAPPDNDLDGVRDALEPRYTEPQPTPESPAPTEEAP